MPSLRLKTVGAKLEHAAQLMHCIVHLVFGILTIEHKSVSIESAAMITHYNIITPRIHVNIHTRSLT